MQKILTTVSTALFISVSIGLGWFIAKQETKIEDLQGQILILESDKNMLKDQLHIDSVYHRRKIENMKFELKLEKLTR